MGMFPDKAVKLAMALDKIEADLVRLQSRVYRVRQALEQEAGRKVGHQYDNPTGDNPLAPSKRERAT